MNPRNSAAAPARIAPVILATIGILACAALVTGMLAGLIVLLTIATAPARDNGQYDDVPDHIRSWFKSVRSPNGVPCCDIADGHRTTWRGTSEGGYEVPIAGEWRKVPPEAVVLNAGNPVGEAIVWYVWRYHGQGGNSEETKEPYIRCFVPGGGV